MGKKQHQQDKLYLTTTEWKTFYGGKKAAKNNSGEFKRLPFYCCSLSMQPFTMPTCTQAGDIFEFVNILAFLNKYAVNPITGDKMCRKELIDLKFSKDSEDKFHCPITFKLFNENSHIVAIKTTGNVFSYDAVDRLNIKVSFWKDLLNDEPFCRKDIITLQQPQNLDKSNYTNFYHIKQKLKLPTEEELEALKKAPKNKASTSKKSESGEKKLFKNNTAHYSTGQMAAGFTSTTMEPVTNFEPAIIAEETLRYSRVKKKAYVQLFTTCGVLNIELNSDMVPKTCENFVKHCSSGYYNDTIFHRSIKNFIIQGGDPEGTGKGGKSIWGEAFKDEFKSNLVHKGRGILSMANSGPNTNKSQFFITFRSARHLDKKHTVFGQVVGGLDTLDKMENIKTDAKERPATEIRLETCTVVNDPFEEVDEELKAERKKEEDEEKAKSTAPPLLKSFLIKKAEGSNEGVGRYLDLSKLKRAAEPPKPSHLPSKKAKKAICDFSSW